MQEIGRELNVDGVLIIWIKEQRINEGKWTWELGLNIALMNIPLFYHIVAPDFGASIYETVTGQLVWREEHSVAPDPEGRLTTLPPQFP